jgi:hypothetical protein
MLLVISEYWLQILALSTPANYRTSYYPFIHKFQNTKETYIKINTWRACSWCPPTQSLISDCYIVRQFFQLLLGNGSETVVLKYMHGIFDWFVFKLTYVNILLTCHIQHNTCKCNRFKSNVFRIAAGIKQWFIQSGQEVTSCLLAYHMDLYMHCVCHVQCIWAYSVHWHVLTVLPHITI